MRDRLGRGETGGRAYGGGLRISSIDSCIHNMRLPSVVYTELKSIFLEVEHASHRWIS